MSSKRRWRWFCLALVSVFLALAATTVAGSTAASPKVPNAARGVIRVRPTPVPPRGDSSTSPDHDALTAPASLAGPAAIESVSGSDVTTGDCYDAGTPQTLCFSVYNGSFDGARLKLVRLTFPDYSGLGPWVVGCSSQDAQDSSGSPVNFTCTAPGTNEVVYEDPTGGVAGVKDKATWGFCVDVTIPAGYNGSRHVHWGIDSTFGPGNYAPRDLTGSTEMDLCEPLMLTPSDRVVKGCGGVTQTHGFQLWNNTASAGTFTLTYRVCSGEGTFTGPSNLSLAAGERVAFDTQLRADLCLMAGRQILGHIEVEGHGYSDEALIAHSVSEFDGWEQRADSPHPVAYGAVAWAVHDDGLWIVGGQYGERAVQRYDPSSDTWTDSYARQPQPAIQAAGEGCYGLDSDRHEVIVLFPDTYVTGTLQRYDITDDTWDSLPVPAGYPAGGRWGQDIVSTYGPAGENVCYLSGGSTQHGGGGEVRDLWAYYPATSTTIYLGSFSQQLDPFNHHASWYVPWVGAEGAICVGGGLGTSAKRITDTQCFDLGTETFNVPNADLGTLPESVYAMADGWKEHNGLYQIWIAGGQTDVYQLTGGTVYADELTGGFVYGPELGSRTKYLEGDAWKGHFYAHGGIAYKFPSVSNEVLAQCRPCLEWEKEIGAKPWNRTITWLPGITLTVETSDTFALSDGFDTNQPLSLTVSWDADRLELFDWGGGPIPGSLITGTGELLWEMPSSGYLQQGVIKWYRVLPSTWTTTMVTETLRSLDQPAEQRVVEIHKLPSDLWIESYYDPAAAAGQSAFVTLEFGNSGGFENGVTISNTFPVTAPMVWADPLPAAQDPGGLWARWDVGDLPAEGWGSIVMEVLLDPGLVAPATVGLWHGIVDHEGTVQDEAVTEFEIGEPAEAIWEKWINGEPWYPEIAVPVETLHRVLVVDKVETEVGFSLVEEWDAGRLLLIGAETNAGDVASGEGGLTWEVGPGGPEVAVITKTFRAQDSTWYDVQLWEELSVGGEVYAQKPVQLVKEQPVLVIEAAYDPEVVSGWPATIDLSYANVGGYESRAWISATFPVGALFQESDPAPTDREVEGQWALWELGGLVREDGGVIAITVGVAPGSVISTGLDIQARILNHVDEVQSEASVELHVGPPPPPEWEKRVDGQEWAPDLVVSAETADTIEVVDVFTAVHAFNLTEVWAPYELALVDWAREPEVGTVFEDEGFLEWNVPPLEEAQLITLTKTYQVLPCVWEATVVQEMLSVGDEVVEQRPVYIVKEQPELWIASSYEPEAAPGQVVSFTLRYGNLGGYENDVWIRNEFPPEAPFGSSQPPPAEVAEDRQTVWWSVGDLARDDRGMITVTVGITETMPYSTSVGIWDGIYNHVGQLQGEMFLEFTIPPAKIYLPLVTRNHGG